MGNQPSCSPPPPHPVLLHAHWTMTQRQRIENGMSGDSDEVHEMLMAHSHLEAFERCVQKHLHFRPVAVTCTLTPEVATHMTLLGFQVTHQPEQFSEGDDHYLVDM